MPEAAPLGENIRLKLRTLLGTDQEEGEGKEEAQREDKDKEKQKKKEAESKRLESRETVARSHSRKRFATPKVCKWRSAQL